VCLPLLGSFGKTEGNTLICLFAARSRTAVSRYASLALSSVNKKRSPLELAAETALNAPVIASSGPPPPLAERPLIARLKMFGSLVTIGSGTSGSLKGASTYSAGSSSVPSRLLTIVIALFLTASMMGLMPAVVSMLIARVGPQSSFFSCSTVTWWSV
jgi:hypothetical protein